MEHIFHKIILNIYFDHIHIMCLYRVFFRALHGLYTNFYYISITIAYISNGKKNVKFIMLLVLLFSFCLSRACMLVFSKSSSSKTALRIIIFSLLII